MADQTIPDWARDSAAPAAPAAAGSPDWAQDSTTAPAAGPVSKPFKDEDFLEYQRLVRSRTTTPAQLTDWLQARGYGRSTNAAEVLTFHRRNPKIAPTNTYTQNPATPAPDGLPQPGTSTDWLPDFIQAPIERLGLSLGIIDPKTYYGLGNYGPNARAPNRETTISNPALPSWGQRFVRSMSETFDPAGGGINAYILRANKDIADDDAIRHYGSDHNWTGEQIDAAIKEAQRQRAAAYAETRAQRVIRDNDEIRRAEGLGVDPKTGEANSSWGGWASRGSADLLGGIVGDANPTYFLAPAGKPVVAGVEALAERLAPGTASKALTAVAPTAGRAAGQGVVQATTNVVTQADEVQRGLRENINPVEVGVHTLLGATFQGGAEALGKLAPNVARWITSRGGRVEGTIAEPAQLSQLDQDLALLAERGTDITSIGSVEKIHQAANDNPVLTRNPRPKLLADNDNKTSDYSPDNFFQVPPLTQKEAWNAADLLADEFGLTPEQVRQQMGKDFPEDWATERVTTPNETPDAVAPQEAAPAGPESVAPDAAPAPELASAPQDDVVTRLTKALSAAGKARDEQTALYKKERSLRVAKAGQAIDSLTGEDAIRASSAALRGEYPKADFESVAKNFSQEDVTALQEKIRTADTLTVFGKQKAWSGLRKALHGEIPQGSELKELAQVFPQDFIKAVLSNRSVLQKSRNTIQEVWNLPKSLVSTADLSAPLRQGIGLVHKKEWRESFKEMHKYLVSPDKFNELETAIRKAKYYDKMEEGGLSLPGVYETAQEVEDSFSSHLAQRLIGIGKINRASERAYVGFLNKLRADTFSNLLDTAVKKGLDIDDPTLVKSLAKVVNTATGRGHLGNFEKAANELNMVFFSPRMLKARLETVTNVFDPRLHPFARKEALKSFAATGTYWATMASLASLAGYSVETDPRSSDFMKAKDGNLRIDFSGGYGPIVVAGARYLTEQSKSLKTGDIRDLKKGGDTAEDAVIKFFRNKLSPTASLIVDAKTGKNSIGEKFEWGPAIASRAVPLSLPDVLLTLHDKGVEGVPVSVLALYGIGLQNFNENDTGERVMDYPYPFGSADTNTLPLTAAPENTEIPDWAK